MKKLILAFLILTLCLSLCACGQQGFGDGDEASQLYSKYQGLIGLLESGDYDAAAEAVQKMKKDALAAEAGDINESLVTVTLTTSNFEDYFTFVQLPGYDSFGDEDGFIRLGLRSKKFSDGWILYAMDNAAFCDDIVVEYTTDAWGFEDTGSQKLTELLRFMGGFGNTKDDFNVVVSRLAGTKLTYIRSDYIQSYDIPSTTAPDRIEVYATITLKNGETLYRWILPEYPY